MFNSLSSSHNSRLDANSVIVTEDVQCGPKIGTFLYALTTSNIDQFSHFTVGIRREIVIVLSLKIPPHLKCIATLPCKTLVSYKSNKWKQDDFL